MLMTRARWTLLLMIGIAFAFAAYGRAQPGMSSGNGAASNGRTAVVNLYRIFDETRQIADLNEKIRSQETEFRAEAERRQKVIEEKQTTLANAFRPGTPDHETRRKELVRLNIEFNVWGQTTESDIERTKYEWTKLIYEESLKIVDQIANERGYDVVLQNKQYSPMLVDPNVTAMRRVIQDRTVVFYRNDVDITDEVIRRMNDAYQATQNATPGGVNAGTMKAP